MSLNQEEIYRKVLSGEMSKQEAMKKMKLLRNQEKTGNAQEPHSASPETTRVEIAPSDINQIKKQIKTIVLDVLHISDSDLDEGVSFKDIGVDSISGVEIIRDINQTFQVNLDTVVIYDHSTIQALTELVYKQQQKNGTAVFKSVALKEPELTVHETVEQKSGSDIKQIRDLITGIVSERLHIAEHELQADAGFKELGVDSISGVEIIREVNRGFALNLDTVVIYDHPTILKLAEHVQKERKEHESLVKEVRGQDEIKAKEESHEKAIPVKTVNVSGDKVVLRQKEEVIAFDMDGGNKFQEITPNGNIILKRQNKANPIRNEEKREKQIKETSKHTAEEAAVAVIGMSGRFPGADNLKEFWSNLEYGVESIMEIPKERWDIDSYYDSDPNAQNKTYCIKGGFLSDVDMFDPLFFNISPKEAEMMDPQQRIFLEESWNALEDAGYSDRALSDMKCGVFAGTTKGDYSNQMVELGIENTGDAFTGMSSSILSGRVSYFLNLKGPSVSIDTACSSSLVAVHQAYRSILDGECELALAGGVILMLSPDLYIKCSRLGLLSKNGHCKAFDDDADGLVFSEGAGVVVLKSLERAIEDGDHIYGVIRGSGMNQNGRTNGLAAPSASPQTDLEVDVYTQFNIHPEDISYVEAHGAGTPLGDPIEIKALKEAFSKFTDKKNYCSIGSVKANIGQATMAAGVAGLMKILLSFQNKKIPPLFNYKKQSSHIDFENSPFYVSTEVQDWEPSNGKPRLAALSSLGFSGTNCHMVIEEPNPLWNATQSKDVKREGTRYLFALSAKTQTALQQKVKDVQTWLENEGKAIPLKDISRTLLSGRSHFKYRMAFTAVSKQEMLQRLADGEGKDCKTTNLDSCDDGIKVIKYLSKQSDFQEEEANLLKLVQFYEEGYQLDFSHMFRTCGGITISMPTYPFEKERCWLPDINYEGKETANRMRVEPSAIKREGLTHSAKEKDLKNDLIKEIKQLIGDLMKINPSKLDEEENLGNYGFNSIALKELSLKMSDTYQLEISPIVFFAHSSVAKLADYLYENGKKGIVEHNVESSFKTEDIKWVEERKRNIRYGQELTNAQKEPVAIIGTSSVLPGSENNEQFWNNLMNERDLITEIPSERWDWRTYYKKDLVPHYVNAKWGGFVKDIDKFDAKFFKISRREAELMDPQQRMFLETTWKTIEDSGYRISNLAGKKVGVFVGAQFADYKQMLMEADKSHAQFATGNAGSILANRISFLLNLHGPSETIDVACASSLAAVNRAVKSVQCGECEMAVAGGVGLMISPDTYVAIGQLGVLSPDGHCKTFDASANGYVRGEGVGAILIKPLSRAIADNDNIYAVIKGASVNHCGRSNSLTAPNSEAQAEVLATAYWEANITPETITYIEAHGTGTELGDPVEINGLKKAFHMLWGNKQDVETHRNYCGLGSVKTNIGHLEPTSGIAGLIKVILSMKNKMIPASLHMKSLNPYIELTDSPFYIVNQSKPWERLMDDDEQPIPRRAGVSSFGFGGYNAHIVLEEFERTKRPQDEKQYAFVLSAQNKERLQEYAKIMAEHFEKYEDLSLYDAAYTMQVGREEMEERFAVLSGSRGELIESLNQYAQGHAGNYYTGNANDFKQVSGMIFEGRVGEEFLDLILREKNQEKLVQLWAAGISIDWMKLYEGRHPARISLPSYPFQRDSFWIENTKKGNTKRNSGGNVSNLHPLIDENISTLHVQGYAKTFNGNEFVLADHIVNGKSVLPGAAYIELARAAGELAECRKVKAIEDLFLLKQFLMDEDAKSIYVNLYPNDENVEFEVIDPVTKAVYSQGNLLYAGDAHNSEHKEQIDIEAIKNRCHTRKEASRGYEQYLAMGLEYQEGFKPIKKLWGNKEEVLSKLELSEKLRADHSLYQLHPSLVDGVFQTLIGFTGEIEKDMHILHLPYAIGRIEIFGSIPKECYGYMRLTVNDIHSSVKKFDMKIVDMYGTVLAKIEDFAIRKAEGVKKTNYTDDEALLHIFEQIENDELEIGKAEKLIGGVYVGTRN